MAAKSIGDTLPLSAEACPLPRTGYLRLHQIIGRPARKGRSPIAAIIPVSRSTWWAGVKSGRYPRPTHALGGRITAWRVEDIRKLLSPGDERTTEKQMSPSTRSDGIKQQA
ncbi:helix-turn-helix transcriptional regulator [Luteibacter jiangsuensis]